MKKQPKEVDKSVRDEVMKEISLQYRKNQKTKLCSQKVNIFQIWLNHDMTYSEFLDVILSLEAQEYLHYHRADENANKYNVKGECVPQEFVTLEPSGKSFPETLYDGKKTEVKTNLKHPLLVQMLTILMTLLLSSASLGLLWQIIKWFLSLFHF